MAVLSLYSRPKVMRPCLDALNEFFEGRIDKNELERRARELESKQQDLFRPQITQIAQREKR